MSYATFLLVLFGFVFTVAADEPPRPLVFQGITVIDCTGGPAKLDMTVIVVGDQIVSLGKADDLTIPNDAQVIDGANKYMIPGLWDMHIHDRYWADGLFLANGVTGTRIMSGSPSLLRERDKTGSTEGQYVGRVRLKDSPDVPFLRKCVASPIMDGPDPIQPRSRAVKDARQAEQAVREFKQQGYQLLKVYSLLPRDAYYGIANAAKKQAIPFGGHVPFSITAAEASEAGQASIEHLSELYLACSSKEQELRKQASGRTRRARDTYDSEKAKTLFAAFVENQTWQVPTLTVMRWAANANNDKMLQDSRLRYVDRREVRRWRERAQRYVDSNADFRQLRQDFQQDLHVVGEMHKAHVRILAGTDTGNPFCLPGFSLHDELELLVSAGLSPLEALQSATKSPAEYLGRQQDLGTVERGKLADLVILNSDPLKDINAVRDISSVVFAGKLYSREQLDLILAEREIENQIWDMAESFDVTKLERLKQHRSIGEVNSLSLRGLQVSDPVLQFLFGLPELQNLDLVSTRVSERDLESIATLEKLHTLRLSGPSIGDEGVAKLASLESLQVLLLDATRTTDSGINAIKGMSRLTDLSLARTAVTDTGLSQLSEMKNLARLWVNDTQVTDEGLRHLAQLENLKYLALGRTKITDRGLSHLSRLQQLEYLGLGFSQITDDGIPHLIKMTNLRRVNLRSTKVTDQGLAPLSRLPHLEELALNDTAVTEEGVADLKRSRPHLNVTR